jgi:Raf kinase inhibitor-like YbhB/YbcL family protein
MLKMEQFGRFGSAVAVTLLCCSAGPAADAEEASVRDSSVVASEEAEMRIMTPAFKEGEVIPKIFTCDGEDVSPPLSWESAPEGTRSFVLISDDPDAPMGTWVHWVLYNIPPDTTALPQGMPKDAALKDGSRQGVTDFGRPGYGGPCPPKGKPHRYYFKLYALDAVLELEGKPGKKDVEKAMKGHIIAEAQIMGTYQRR